MTATPEKLLTLGDAARRFGVPQHVLRYAVESRRIEPVQRAGILRLFSEGQLPAMKSALLRTAGGRHV